MSDRTIDEATPDTQVTGVENIPVSDGGSPKCVTVTQVKDFVLSKIGTIANVSTPAISTDGVYIKRNSELKPISAQDLANAIISFAFSKEEVSTLTTEAVIVIKSGNDIKTTDVNELAEVVKDAIELNAFDIASLPSATVISKSGYMAITQLSQATSGNHVTRKRTIAEVTGAFVSAIHENLNTETTQVENDDYFMMFPNGGAYPKKVKKSNLGFGTGNVIGPSANTDGKIPQWDGANSKTLKDGLTVTGTVASGSSSTEIPTAAAVYSAISNITVSGDVTGPASSTDGQMALFNGYTGKIIKAGGKVSNSIGTIASTANVTTENAVRTEAAAQISASIAAGGLVRNAIDAAVASNVTGPALSTDGQMVVFNGTTGKCIKAGGIVSNSIGTVASSTNVTTENAVRTETEAQIAASIADGGSVKSAIDTATSNKAIAPSSPITGRIPRWSGTGTKVLTDDLSLVTTISSTTPSNSKIPSENAVLSLVNTTIGTRLENIVRDEGDQSSGLATVIGHWTTPYGSGVINHYGRFAFPTDIVKVSNESVTSGSIPEFDGTTGKLIRQGYYISSTTDPTPPGTDTDRWIMTVGRYGQLRDNNAHFMGSFRSTELPSSAPEGSWALDINLVDRMYVRRSSQWYKIALTQVS